MPLPIINLKKSNYKILGAQLQNWPGTYPLKGSIKYYPTSSKSILLTKIMVESLHQAEKNSFWTCIDFNYLPIHNPTGTVNN
jgi:hypothetical protein